MPFNNKEEKQERDSETERKDTIFPNFLFLSQKTCMKEETIKR